MKEAITRYIVTLALGVIIGLVSMFMLSGGCGSNKTLTFSKDGISTSKTDTVWSQVIIPGDTVLIKAKPKVIKDTIFYPISSSDSALVLDLLSIMDSLETCLKAYPVERIERLDTCLDMKPAKLCLDMYRTGIHKQWEITAMLDTMSFKYPAVTNTQTVTINANRWYEEPYISYPVGLIAGILATIFIDNNTK